jgi:FkbM family methyltransferase
MVSHEPDLTQWPDSKPDTLLTPCFLAILEKLPVRASVEVGAFDAVYSRCIAARYPNMPILAFEASPFVYERFRQHMPPEISYRNIAVSESGGQARLQIQLEYEDQSLVRNNSIMLRSEDKPYGYVNVPSDSLDQLCSGLDAIALWIDAEGANSEVLRGAANALSRTLAIFIETEHTSFWEQQWAHRDVKRYLDSQGFSLTHINMQFAFQGNCIFVRRECVPLLGRPSLISMRAAAQRMRAAAQLTRAKFRRWRDSVRVRVRASAIGSVKRAIFPSRNL